MLFNVIMDFDRNPHLHQTKKSHDTSRKSVQLALGTDDCFSHIQKEDAEFYQLHKQWREERKASKPSSVWCDDSLVIQDELDSTSKSPIPTEKEIESTHPQDPSILSTDNTAGPPKKPTSKKRRVHEGVNTPVDTKSISKKAKRQQQVLDLYYACNAYKDGDKPRPTLRIHDPHKDMVNLESRIVTQCEWIANVPEACLGFHKGCNQAIKALHALIGGPANINFKEKLCMNATGERYMVSKAMKDGVLHEYLHDPSS